MKLSSFTIIVTDACNYDCAYCRQRKEEKYITTAAIEKAAAFFYPFLKEEADINFYGGEPLLAFESIKHAVTLFHEKDRVEKKKPAFSTTTNGSLMTDEVLDFFDRHNFSILFSFDGLTQDIARQPGSRVPTLELLRRLHGDAYPGIDLTVNSVFTPATVTHLAQSMRYIIEAGGTDIQFNVAEDHPWDEGAVASLEKELEELAGFLLSYYRENGTIPVMNFRGSVSPREKKKNFTCDALRGRMAVSPGEHIWGCYKFHDYLKDKEESDGFHAYSLGKLDDFIKNRETALSRVTENYALLRQDCFFTGERFCFLCRDLPHCGFCPVYSAYSTSYIGKIPSWGCRLRRIQREQRDKFREKINGIKS